MFNALVSVDHLHLSISFQTHCLLVSNGIIFACSTAPPRMGLTLTLTDILPGKAGASFESDELLVDAQDKAYHSQCFGL